MDLNSPTLLHPPYSRCQRPEGSWCYAKSKFMFQLNVGTTTVIIEKPNFKHRLSPSQISSEDYGFGIQLSDILKNNELLPYLKMPEQDKRALHDWFSTG